MPTTSPTANAMATLAGMVLEDERLWGDVAADFQWAGAEAVFSGSPPNRWEGRPRGGSKTTDAAGIALASLIDIFPSGAEAYVVAADRDQARLTINCLRGLVMRTEALRSVVNVEASRALLKSGSFLEVLPADGPSAWGLKPDLVLVDELSAWPSTANAREVWEAVTTAMGKKPNARLVVLSMAGSPHHWSHEIYQHAKTSTQWSMGDTPGPLPWTDPVFLDEQRALHPDATFRRLFLNQWVAGSDALASREDVERCVVLEGPGYYDPNHRYLLTVDVGLVNDRTVVAVTHAADERKDGLVVNRKLVLDYLWVRQGSHEHPVDLDTVEAVVYDTSRRFGNARALFDQSRAEQIVQRLRRKGMHTDVFNFTTASVGRLGVALHQAIRSHRLEIWRDTALVSELLSVKLRETGPNQYRLDHASSGHDDMAVCLAMACVELLEQPIHHPASWYFEQVLADQAREAEQSDDTALDRAFAGKAAPEGESLFYEPPAQRDAREAAAARLCAHCRANDAARPHGFCLGCDPEQVREPMAP
jgi:hypothetical protein